jgi:hypothetical protein
MIQAAGRQPGFWHTSLSRRSPAPGLTAESKLALDRMAKFRGVACLGQRVGRVGRGRRSSFVSFGPDARTYRPKKTRCNVTGSHALKSPRGITALP